MTWEQALAGVFAIAVTALARFVNMKLPPVLDHPPGQPGATWHESQPHANTEPMAGPPPEYPPLPTQPPDEGTPRM